MHDVAWHHEVNCVRSKDAQKQLAQTSLNSQDCKIFKKVVLVDNHPLRQLLILSPQKTMCAR